MAWPGERRRIDQFLAFRESAPAGVNRRVGDAKRDIDDRIEQGLLDASFQAVEPARAGAGDRRRLFALSPLGEAVASAEAARLDDQVRAARSVKLFRKGGA